MNKNSSVMVHDPLCGGNATATEKSHVSPAVETVVKTSELGRWGRQRLDYLRQHKPHLYEEYVREGDLYRHLTNVDRIAKERLDRMMSQMCRAEGVDYRLQTTDWMAYIRALGNIQSRAQEIIIRELIMQ